MVKISMPYQVVSHYICQLKRPSKIKCTHKKYCTHAFIIITPKSGLSRWRDWFVVMKENFILNRNSSNTR